jgi:hypothetical protein
VVAERKGQWVPGKVVGPSKKKEGLWVSLYAAITCEGICLILCIIHFPSHHGRIRGCHLQTVKFVADGKVCCKIGMHSGIDKSSCRSLLAVSLN